MSRQIQASSEKYPDCKLLGASRASARDFAVAFLQHDNWVQRQPIRPDFA
jgi:hypothetical protein